MDADDRRVIEGVVADLQKQSERPFVVEVEKLQKFLSRRKISPGLSEKNPGGYCHIDFPV